MDTPHIRTALPGPIAQEILARDVRVTSPSYPRDYQFVMDRGRGVEVWDVDGNRFLDFMAGIAVCSTGHAHPDVVAAVQRASERFLHISSDFWHEDFTGLNERLSRLAPMPDGAMSFVCQSGTEALEAALKLARYATGRPRFIGFYGGFHGRSMGSLSFTASKYTQQKGYFAGIPGVTHVPYPNPYRPVLAGDDQGEAVLRYLRDVVFASNVPASEVAAIVLEPLLGEGGYVVPPPGFLPGLRDLCDEHGILLVLDEVQTGVGRTGRMFAAEHFDVQPDIMAVAKGLGSGLPIGAMVGRPELVSRWQPGAHGNTYGGNPLSCAAACATLDLVAGGLVDNAADVGRHVMRRAADLARRYDVIGDVRGLGLFIGVEFVTDRVSKEPAADLVDRIVRRAFHNGLLLLSCGRSTIRLMPPLVVNGDEADEAMDILDASIAESL